MSCLSEAGTIIWRGDVLLPGMEEGEKGGGRERERERDYVLKWGIYRMLKGGKREKGKVI